MFVTWLLLVTKSLNRSLLFSFKIGVVKIIYPLENDFVNYLKLSLNKTLFYCLHVISLHDCGFFFYSALKLIHMCSISSHLGPLQLSLKRILIDILKFFSIYSLVLFSFACGLNQLMWYFADLERRKCYSLEDNASAGIESCSKWKNFGK